MTKAELARRLGVRWPTVHDWINGKSVPKPDHLRMIAEVLPVTLEELMGVAAGQDPPFAAWAEFLGTAEGAAITPDERRALQAIPWPPGREPTVASYHVALASLRTTIPRS
jgi:transcriptional regulator with XRE-family HTH domain